jgi:hypothetical protein
MGMTDEENVIAFFKRLAFERSLNKASKVKREAAIISAKAIQLEYASCKPSL